MAKVADLRWLLDRLSSLEAQERGQTEPYPDQTATLRQNREKYPGLVPYETKGRFKLLNKYSQMKVNYRENLGKAKEKYDALPFGPRTKAAFRAALDAQPDKAFNDKLVVSHEKKWANKWMNSISR